MREPLSFALEELEGVLARAALLPSVPLDLPRANAATATLRRYASQIEAPLARAMIATHVRRLLDAFERVVVETERRLAAA
jgi:hypothetical protein